jgi:cell division protein FtsQ
LERLKPMQRNATAAAESAEPYRPELIADEEPRYLRRQKPVEIRRKKLGGRGWPFYRRVLLFTAAGTVLVIAAFYGARFLLYSPAVLLLKPDQIEVTGNRVVSREAVLQQFVQDRNHSVLQISLDARRSQLEQFPWVESASVQRLLPNRIHVELTERTPIAFARLGSELALIDGHGVILDRPRDVDLHFPIVTGISEEMPREQREKRMQLYQEFLKDIELVRGGSSQNVSEVDLSNPKDLRVVMTGLASATDSQAVTIHFGSSDFSGKFKMLVDNFSQWQANAGKVQSIDLQYTRQVVVNPDTSAGTAAAKAK